MSVGAAAKGREDYDFLYRLANGALHEAKGDTKDQFRIVALGIETGSLKRNERQPAAKAARLRFLSAHPLSPGRILACGEFPANEMGVTRYVLLQQSVLLPPPLLQRRFQQRRFFYPVRPEQRRLRLHQRLAGVRLYPYHPVGGWPGRRQLLRLRLSLRLQLRLFLGLSPFAAPEGAATYPPFLPACLRILPLRHAFFIIYGQSFLLRNIT